MKLLLTLLLTFPIVSQAQIDLSWLKPYTGTIGKAKFTMLLHKAGDQYNAAVYYNSTEQPYFIDGASSTLKVNLTGSAQVYNNNETWTITLSKNGLSGVWKCNEKTLPINAQLSNPELNVQYVYTQGNKLLTQGIGVPEATYYQSGIYYPQNAELNKILYPNIANLTAGQYMLQQKNAYFDNYIKINKDVLPTDYKDNIYMYSHDSKNSTMLTYLSPNIISYTHTYYEYTGGAHGNGGSVHTVIQKASSSILTLADVVVDSSQLTPYLIQYFRKHYGVKANETLTDAGLFENTITANSNFILTNKAIIFTYNAYDISPYAMGQINIAIPLSAIKNILTPKIKNILQPQLN